MLKKASNVMPILLAFVLTVALTTGCGGSNSLTFPVSGQVTDTNGEAMPGVTILFNGVPGATSDMKGNWTKTGVSNSVKVTAQKEGYAFARFKDGNPVSNTPVTKGPNQLNLKFTGYEISETQFSNAKGKIVNRGADEPKAVNGQGLAGVILRYDNPITNEEMTVTTDSNGDWEIKETLAGVVEVSVQSAPAGWMFIPSSFLLTSDNFQDFIMPCTSKSYSGIDVYQMITGNDLVNNEVAPPADITIGGETISPADAFYIITKWLALYGAENTQAGTVSTQVPYLKITKPDSLLPSGVTEGVMKWPNIYEAAKTISAELETTPFGSNPTLLGGYMVGWALDGGSAVQDKILGSDDLLNLLARAIPYVQNNNKMPNYSSWRNAAAPIGW